MALLTQAELAPAVGTTRVLPTVVNFDLAKRARSVVNESFPLLAETTRVVRTVLVVDVVESVRLMQDDEAGAVQRWRSFVDHVVHRLLPTREGRLVKSLGDGLMLEFPRVHPAIDIAFAMQEASARGNEGVAADRCMRLRIGIHVSPLVADEHDVYGHGVNLAARLTTLAGPDEIVVSAEVRDQLTPALDADVEDLGECYLKHVTLPVRAYRLGLPGDAPVIEASSHVSQELRPIIAVIPFSLRAPDPDQDILGQIIADGVISALSQSSDLLVVSRLSTTAFRDRSTTLQEVTSFLRANYLLSGSYHADGDRLAVHAELADTKSSQVAWSKTLKGSVRGIVAGNDSIISQLVSESAAAMLLREVQRSQQQALPTLESYTLLLSSITLMHRISLPAFERARSMLQVLIERAPRMALPYAWLAKWHVLRVTQGWSDDSQSDSRQALENTKRALDKDPSCSLALTVEGQINMSILKRLDIAAERYEAALLENPNDALAWLLKGTLHAFKDEGKEAVRHTRHALNLSPLDPLRFYFECHAASALLSTSQYEKALEVGKRSLRLNRTHASTLRVMATASWHLGLVEEAREIVKQHMQLDPAFRVSTYLERSPSAPYEFGKRVATALTEAGAPP